MTRAETLSKKVHNIIEELSGFIVERDEEIKGVFLAILAQKNLLFLGDPGIAKTMIVDNIAKRITGAKYFEQAMHSQIKLEELYGPISIRTLEKEDKLVHKTEGMLPEAHIAYLDELWKSNAGPINSLLKCLNEKVFFNGGTPVKIPLMSLLSASNEIPEEEDDLAAAYDRFLIKYHVEKLQDKDSDIKMHMAQLNRDPEEIKHTISLEEIQELQTLVKEVSIDQSILHTNYRIKQKIYSKFDGLFYVNERTSVHAMRVLQTEAILNGRMKVQEPDLEVLKHLYWKDPSQIKTVKECILKTVAYDKSKLTEIKEKLIDLKKEYQAITDDQKSKNEAGKILQNINTLKEEAKGIKGLMEQSGKDTKVAVKLFRDLESFAQEIYDTLYSTL